MARRQGTRGWFQAQPARHGWIPRAILSVTECRRSALSIVTARAPARTRKCTVGWLFGRELSSFAPGGSYWAWSPPTHPCRFRRVEVRGQHPPAETPTPFPMAGDGLYGQWHSGSVHATDPRSTQRTRAPIGWMSGASVRAAQYARSTSGRMLMLPRSSRDALDPAERVRFHTTGLSRSTYEPLARSFPAVQGQPGRGFGVLRMVEEQKGLTTRRTRPPATLALPTRSGARCPSGLAARKCPAELPRRCSPQEWAGPHPTLLAETAPAGGADSCVCLRMSAGQAGLSSRPIRTEMPEPCIPARVSEDLRMPARDRFVWRPARLRCPGLTARVSGSQYSNSDADG
jgi:hypothetical protein